MKKIKKKKRRRDAGTRSTNSRLQNPNRLVVTMRANDLEEWLALGPELSEEDLLELGFSEDLAIIDAHHHFFAASKNDLPREHYEWFGARINSHKPFMEKEMMACYGKLSKNVKASIFVECTQFYDRSLPKNMWPVGETRAVHKMASNTRVKGILGAVGNLGMDTEEFQQLLDAHASESRYFKGLRYLAGVAEPKRKGQIYMYEDKGANTLFSEYSEPISHEYLCTSEVVHNAKVMAERGMILDVFIFYHQLPSLVKLAKAVPELTIVCNHAGGVLGISGYDTDEVRKEVKEDWEQGVRALATCSNVRMKLGGLLMHYSGLGLDEKETPASAQELADAQYPTFSVLLELFTPARCMFESNFPVDRVSSTFVNLFASFMIMAKRFSASETDIKRLFAGTAAETYHISLD